MTKVLPGYTRGMKTAISVPDETFRRVDLEAAAIGISRSEFYARGAELYLRHLVDSSLTSRIDEVVTRGGVATDAGGKEGLRRLGELTEGDAW